ncbi:MAG TPA: acetylglutamate kinase [Aggregatilineales bacterium]|nr:acetylglutamate kinase [Aggregatilineales bacterium]
MHIDVIKIGGNDLETEGFIPQLARAIAGLNGGRRCIVVHGGGRSISALMEQLGVEATFVNGQRITNEAGLRVAEMVLSGSVNKLLTLALLEAGVDAMGLSGVDRGLLRAERWAEAGSPEDMGLVGRIVEVRADVLRELCAEGVVPVISPISAGPGGRYNVNADHAAGTIAGAVGARRAVFVSNVPGVKVGDEVAPRLTADEVNELIEAGVIRDGMIPKVRAALDALAKGAQSAVITNLTGLQADAGTTVVLG